MINVIEKLRELIGDDYEGNVRDEQSRNIRDILDAYKPKGYETKVVDESFEEGGRWSNYETEVYYVKQGDGKTAYFSVCREIPATEMQEGGDFSVYVREVVPKEVVKIEYVCGRSA